MDYIEGVIDETEGVSWKLWYSGRKNLCPELPGFGMKLIWGQDLDEFVRLGKENYGKLQSNC